MSKADFTADEKVVVGCLLGLVLYPATIVLTSLATRDVWNGFLAPLATLPTISLWQAWAVRVMLVVGFKASGFQILRKDDRAIEPWSSVHTLSASALAYGFAQLALHVWRG